MSAVIDRSVDVRDALRLSRGNVLQAAARLGISRPALYRRLRRWSIDPESYRDRRSNLDDAAAGL